METKVLKFEVKANTSQRRIEGYASTWDRDQIDDIIHHGAFAKTIRERGPKGANRIKVLWQHVEAMGIPLHMEEDSTGLFTDSKISKTRIGDEALELISDGVVDSMSIGFDIPAGKAEYRDDGWTRDIHEVKLLEYSPVTFACNEAALIQAVKNIESASHGAMKGRAPANLMAEIERLKALLEGREPLDTSGTRGNTAPPSDGIDPEFLRELQSVRETVGAFAFSATARTLKL